MTPEESLALTLRELHLLAGKPSSRKIAQAVGGVSHTTVSELLRGARVPAWDIVEKVCRFLSGNLEEVRSLWVATQRISAKRDEENSSDLWDPVYLERMVVTSFIGNRGARELRTIERWVRATRDSVDHYIVRASTSAGLANEHGGGAVNVEPYLNCSIGKVKQVKLPEEGAALLVEVLLASPLNNGEVGFFATRNNYDHAPGFTDYSQVTITSQGARELIFRVQFAADSVPKKCWGYIGGSDVDMFDEPRPGSRQILHISSAGYVELEAQNLPPGARMGIIWNWE
ncbi:helix-turn-helix domain-containing protein [Amycolatopsis sp. NPDC058278]|uniref:helix-turn-helix domain-containing protein n=1 Tax=Amycolatopsis sp. NPDC058278 TaxID=3346417 RepID=UPI0036DE2027